MGTNDKLVSFVVSNKRRASSAWVGCLLAVACGGELPQQTSGAESAAADSAHAEPEASPETLLAEILLSPSHRIEFVQKAHGAAIGRAHPRRTAPLGRAHPVARVPEPDIPVAHVPEQDIRYASPLRRTSPSHRAARPHIPVAPRRTSV
jgi:hypothetical protein